MFHNEGTRASSTSLEKSRADALALAKQNHAKARQESIGDVHVRGEDQRYIVGRHRSNRSIESDGRSYISL